MKLCFLVLTLVFANQAYAEQSSTLKQPNISANGLFLYRNSNLDNSVLTGDRNGIDIQEAELALYADVDPYSRFNMLLTVHPDYANGSSSATWIVEPEELYAESSQISDVTLKVGKFKAAFGKHNLLHTHAFPFVEQPITNTYLLGSDGLQDAGASAAILIPTSWYNELTVQYLNGKGTASENIGFKSNSPNDGIGLAHWKNLVDFTDSATGEGGLSAATGKNAAGYWTRLYGLDLTFKWRPVEGGRYKSAIIGSEVIRRELDQGPTTNKEISNGGNIWGQYQFSERWTTGVRLESFQVANSRGSVNPQAIVNGTTTKGTIDATFAATEFSAYRFEFSSTSGPHNSVNGDYGQDSEKKFYIQANFTIGAHPAHAY